MAINSTSTKVVYKMFLETEGGKELVNRIKIYKNHCIDEKMKFYRMVKNNPELLNVGDNRLRYNCYIDDIIKVIYDPITNKRFKQIKEKHDRIIKNNKL